MAGSLASQKLNIEEIFQLILIKIKNNEVSPVTVLLYPKINWVYGNISTKINKFKNLHLQLSALFTPVYLKKKHFDSPHISILNSRSATDC